MLTCESNKEEFAGIAQATFAEFGGGCDSWCEFGAGEIQSEIGPLPHHLVCSTPTIMDAGTDLTMHLWDDMARIVMYREWENDTALVGQIHYDQDFGDKLQELIQQVEQRLRVIPDTREVIESLVIE